MSALPDIMRALAARVGIVLVRTSCEDILTEQLTTMLRTDGHRVTEWSCILGERRCAPTKEHPELAFGPWDSSKQGSLLAALATWVAALQEISSPNAEDDWVYCAACNACYSAATKRCEKHKCAAKVRSSYRTLIVRGAAHFIEDGGPHLDPLAVRALWDIAVLNQGLRANLIVLLPAGTKVPANLVQYGVLIDDALPSRQEIAGQIWPRFVTDVAEGSPHRTAIWQGVNVADATTVAAVTDRLAGLSFSEIRSALTQSLIAASEVLGNGGNGWGTFLQHLATTKAAGIKKSPALEVIPPAKPEDLGGVPLLRRWIETRRKAFSPTAKAAGLPTPKGCLLVGPPGTGKSLSAKVIAAVLGFELIKLDVGALFGSLVGQSESAMRLALTVIDAAAPAVVLVDEIDKAFAGVGGDSTDGGTTQRVFGTFLTWMAERNNSDNPIFVTASANDIRRLPPEILRKGRFDDIFFLDLPNDTERREILQIHMGKTNKAAGQEVCRYEETEWDLLLSATTGFVGAELEQMVKEARITAFEADEPTVSAPRLIEAARDTKPLSKTMSEVITHVRDWAKDRARRASPVAAPGVYVPPAGPAPMGGLSPVSLKGMRNLQ